jgi:hypothetical protein
MTTKIPYTKEFIEACLAEFPDDDKLRRQLDAEEDLRNTSLFCANNEILDSIHPGEIVKAIEQMDAGDRTLLDELKIKAERATRRDHLRRTYYAHFTD